MLRCHFYATRNLVYCFFYLYPKSEFSGDRILKRFTTVFVDTRLWKTKHSRKRFQKFPSIIRVIDMSDRNPPITATSVTFYVMLAGCDWRISIQHVDNTYDWRKFLETFPRVFCFPKSRINENGGNNTLRKCFNELRYANLTSFSPPPSCPPKYCTVNTTYS